MAIERTPVKSSNVTSVGFDPETGTMAVEYKDGSVYHYHNVEPDKHEALVSSKSVGGYIHANIKGNYKHSKQ